MKIFKRNKISDFERRLERAKSVAEATREFLRDISSWQVGRPFEKEFSTDEAIKDGLKKNIWVYSCVEKIAPDVASVPLIVEKKKGDEWELDEKHELNDLFNKPFLNKPLSSLIRRGEMHLLLGGNAIIYHPLVAGKPVGMQPLHPGRVKVVPGDKGTIAEYQRQVDGVYKHIEDSPLSILHVMYEDPDTPYWGLGRYQAATNTVKTSVSAVEWNMNLLKNAVGSDLAILIEQYLQPQQFSEEVEKLNEMYAGAKNAGKPLVFDAGAKAQQLSRTPKEMDYVKSQELAMYAICAAFGVDPRLIGAKEFSGRAARTEAEKAYWMHTIIPEVQYWTEAMSVYYQQFYGDDIRVSYDITNVEALQEEFHEKSKTGRILFDMGVTLEEINRRLEMGLDLENIPGSDSPYGLESRSARRGDKELIWRRKDGQRRIWERRLAEEFSKGLQADAEAVAKAVDAGKKVIDTEKELKKAWEARLSIAYTALAKHFGQAKYEDLLVKGGENSRKRDFNPAANDMAMWIRKISAKRALDIADTTIDTLGRIVSDTIAEGEPLSVAVSRIREQGQGWAEELPRSRAMRIARTESGAGINRASHEARMQVQDEFGWTVKKQWLAAIDDRTRDTHINLDGETVLTTEMYSNGLMYPGDPSGDPEDTINCRCSETEVVER